MVIPVSPASEPPAENPGATPAAGHGRISSTSLLVREGLISMREAAQMYGRNTHKSTPTRHAVKGIPLGNGRRLKLEAIRVSGALCTSRPAVLRFFAAQNDPGDVADDSVPEPPKRNARAQDAASAELDRLLAPKRKPKPE